MRLAPNRAAIAVWICTTLLLSACDFSIPPPEQLPPQPLPEPLPPPPPPPVTPGRVEAEILRWFTAAGYARFQAEALADHARIESGFRPCAAGPAGLRYTYQWGSTRLQQLHRFAGASGCPPLDTQLAFADRELRGSPKFACFWGATDRASALRALRRGFGGGSC